MKFSFKRFLGSALATVMTVSVLSVGMVSSVSAAATTYNFANIQNNTDKVHRYNNANITAVLSGSVDLFGDGVVTVEDGTTPALVDYSHVAEDYADDNTKKTYLTAATTEGTLANTVFTQAIIMTKSSSTSKNFIDVKVNSGDKLEVYYFGCDSKGATGKANGINLSGAGISSTGTATDDVKSVSYISAEATEAGTVVIKAGSNQRVAVTAIVITSAGDITYTDGKVTYNTPAEGGTVSVADDSGKAITSGETVTGGTKCTLTAAPSQGYAATVTVNENPVTLGADNTYKFTVDGDVTINVSFDKVYDRSPITSSVTFDIHNAETHKLVREYGTSAKNEFYFDLTNGASLDTAKGYLRIAKTTDGAEKSVKFTIGNKPATMNITYKSANSSERTITVADVSTNTPVYTDTINNTETTNEQAINLAANTEYYIGASDSMNVYKIEIIVEGSGKIADTLTKTSEGDDYYTHSGADTYIIHPVSEDDMTKSSLSIPEASISTDTVYDAIEFEDGSSINAEDVGGAHKIFAVVVKDTQGKAPTKAINWVLGN